jgi:hypothetical protein
MKKRALTSVIGILTLTPVMLQAGQNTGSTQYHSSDPRRISKKATSILGQVGADGKTFTADKDSRIWKVSNPEALSGIDGRHVKVKAHVDSAQSEIQVLSVSAVAERRAGIKLDDAAFRR